MLVDTAQRQPLDLLLTAEWGPAREIVIAARELPKSLDFDDTSSAQKMEIFGQSGGAILVLLAPVHKGDDTPQLHAFFLPLCTTRH